MNQDTLSDVLRCLRLRSAVFYYVAGRGNWVAEAPPAREIGPAVMPGAEHVMEYHVVIEGECWAAILGQPPVKLGRGDLILLPQGDPHVVSSAPGMRADSFVSSYYEMQHHQRPFHFTYDGDLPRVCQPADHRQPAAARVVCGFIGCDLRPFNPLIAALPRLLHLSAAADGAWSEQFLALAVAETRQPRPGGEVLLERMSETMFVDAIRRHLERLPEGSRGWLAGLRDRHVGRALTLLHGQPAAPWTMDELGRRVGLSRSALHERFLAYIGQPPMQYLAHWRMQLAARMLREGQSSVAAIALTVGYESEAAFTRAFKRLVGLPPAAWRREQGARPAAVPLRDDAAELASPEPPA